MFRPFRRSRLPGALAALGLVLAVGAEPTEMPFSLKGPDGRPIPPGRLLDTPEGRLVPSWEDPSPGPRHALDSLVPMSPGSRGERRRGMFARLFGVKPTPPPLITKYPVVLVHGANVPKIVKLGHLKLRYFAKTEAHLRRLNLRLLVPSVNPMGSIEERAMELKAQIQAAIPEGKFNLVAHSMGGLDARYLASRDPIGARIASITTVATPHHGAWYADFAKKWIFERQGLNKLGGLIGLRFDQIPDLTVQHMETVFNPATPDNPDVAYYSYGTAAPIWKSPPTYWGMNFITRIMERRAARRKGVVSSFGDKVPLGIRSKRGEVRITARTARTLAEATATPPADWVVPRWAGRNDGVVSLSSSVWGTYLGTMPGHHWTPQGWLSFKKEYKFWEAVIRRMASEGY